MWTLSQAGDRGTSEQDMVLLDPGQIKDAHGFKVVDAMMMGVPYLCVGHGSGRKVHNKLGSSWSPGEVQ